MAIDYAKLMAMRIPDAEQTYTTRDSMLYALAVGMGADPLDRRELAFVLEDRLATIPTMATVLAWNDGWLYETGMDMTKQVHGEQRITLHRPLPPAATVVTRTRIADLFDKGPGRGAECTLATRPDQALLYRLCGDRNPLHADPDYAAAGGFPRPILHGLCTMGFACHAVLRAMCDYDSARLVGFDVRFTSPVYPGETLRTEMWRDGNTVSYRTRAAERDVVVLDHGKATLAR